MRKLVFILLFIPVVFDGMGQGEATVEDDTKKNFVAFEGSYALLSISYGRAIKESNWKIGGGIGGYHRTHGYILYQPHIALVREYCPVKVFAVYDNDYFTCETGIRASGIQFPRDEEDRYSEELGYISIGAYITPMIGLKNIKIGPLIAVGLLDLDSPILYGVPVILKYTLYF